MAIIDDFKTKYPAFVPLGDTIIQDALCDAESETGGSGWGIYANECGNFKQRGLFAYAAHVLASTYPSNDPSSVSGSAVGAVVSKSVGDESVTFNTVASDNAGDAWLTSTSFGQQFVRLRRRAGMGARAV
jgi:hypothetical protein